MDREKLELIGKQIVDVAYQVHKELGPGLLESAYERCMTFEFIDRGFHIERQKKLPIVYKGNLIESGYRLDLIVEKEIIIELKTVDHILPVHEAQLISYLKLSGKKLGYLINFNVDLIKNGIYRRVNKL